MKVTRNHLKELVKKTMKEIDFKNQAAFDAYNKKHKMRKSTKVNVGGKDTTAGKASAKGGFDPEKPKGEPSDMDTEKPSDEPERDVGGPAHPNVPKGVKSSSRAKLVVQQDKLAKKMGYRHTAEIIKNADYEELYKFAGELEDVGYDYGHLDDLIDHLRKNPDDMESRKKLFNAITMKSEEKEKSISKKLFPDMDTKKIQHWGEKAYNSPNSRKTFRKALAKMGVTDKNVKEVYSKVRKDVDNAFDNSKREHMKYEGSTLNPTITKKREDGSTYTTHKYDMEQAHEYGSLPWDLEDDANAGDKKAQKLMKLLQNDKKLQQSQEDFKRAVAVKDALEDGWRNLELQKQKSESVNESKGRRCTVKEVKMWMKKLEENRYKKTYNSDARRVSWMVNHMGEGIENMPKSMSKKWSKAQYGRERYLAKEFWKSKKQQMTENKLRESIRTIIKRLV